MNDKWIKLREAAQLLQDNGYVVFSGMSKVSLETHTQTAPYIQAGDDKYRRASMQAGMADKLARYIAENERLVEIPPSPKLESLGYGFGVTEVMKFSFFPARSEIIML